MSVYVYVFVSQQLCHEGNFWDPRGRPSAAKVFATIDKDEDTGALSFAEFAEWYTNSTQKYDVKSGGENCFSFPKGTEITFEWYKKQYNDVQLLKSPAKEVRQTIVLALTLKL